MSLPNPDLQLLKDSVSSLIGDNYEVTVTIEDDKVDSRGVRKESNTSGFTHKLTIRTTKASLITDCIEAVRVSGLPANPT